MPAQEAITSTTTQLQWWPYCLASLILPHLEVGCCPRPEALFPNMQDISSFQPTWCLPKSFEASPLFSASPTGAFLYHLLEQLAGALDASVTYSEGINPFLNPLVCTSKDDKGCMVYDHRRTLPGMCKEISKEGGQQKPLYLRLYLGRNSEGARRLEAAHRVVLLATSGPPPIIVDAPPGEEEDQCYHTCDNPACINPLHLAWASTSENNMRVYKWEQDPGALLLDLRRVEETKLRVMARKTERMREAKLKWETLTTPWINTAKEIYKQYPRG
jgi:hypothetical protein